MIKKASAGRPNITNVPLVMKKYLPLNFSTLNFSMSNYVYEATPLLYSLKNKDVKQTMDAYTSFAFYECFHLGSQFKQIPAQFTQKYSKDVFNLLKSLMPTMPIQVFKQFEKIVQIIFTRNSSSVSPVQIEKQILQRMNQFPLLFFKNQQKLKDIEYYLHKQNYEAMLKLSQTWINELVNIFIAQMSEIHLKQLDEELFKKTQEFKGFNPWNEQKKLSTLNKMEKKAGATK